MTSATAPLVFATRLASARRARRLSQAALARLAGLPPSSISHFETASRRPSLDSLCRLANTLSITTDYLIGADGGTRTTDRIAHALRQLSKDHLEIVERLIDVLALAAKDEGNCANARAETLPANI